MNPERGKNLNVIASVGLTLGGGFGLAGTFAGQANLRNLAWEIDGLGLIVATSLLAIKFFRKGCDAIAAGFLVFAIGESVMLSGMAAGLEGSVPAFAAGTALWATAMLLISFPAEFSLRFDSRASLLPFYSLSPPRKFFGALRPRLRCRFWLPFLVITFAGWIGRCFGRISLRGEVGRALELRGCEAPELPGAKALLISDALWHG
jgi:hypothetical protein